MTQPCYGPDYPDDFKKAVEGLAHREENLLATLSLGPDSISRLEFQLRVTQEDRLKALFSHRAALAQAQTDPETALQAATQLSADLDYLERKHAVHGACVDICPPRFRPTR